MLEKKKKKLKDASKEAPTGLTTSNTSPHFISLLALILSYDLVCLFVCLFIVYLFVY